MIKDAIANIAKPPGFSTSNAPPVLPFHSGAVEQYNSVNSHPKKEIPDHSGQPRGRVEQAASAQARKSHPIKKDPAASAFRVYFESRLERHPPSTSGPLCAGRPIAFRELVASAPH